MKYFVLTSESVSGLSALVEQSLTEGWVLAGGVSVAMSYATVVNERKGYTQSQDYTIFAQAVVKPS